jgi:hypothetical protein
LRRWSLLWDDGADAAPAERRADVGVAVALVPGDALGAQTRPGASGPLDRALVKEAPRRSPAWALRPALRQPMQLA